MNSIFIFLIHRCADKVNDENTKKEGQKTAPTDGLIGLGPHRASWLHQLNLLGLISEYIIAICFEPDKSHESHSQLPQSAGFLSFGNLYSSEGANTIWTANILSTSEYVFNSKINIMKLWCKLLLFHGGAYGELLKS